MRKFQLNRRRFFEIYLLALHQTLQQPMLFALGDRLMNSQFRWEGVASGENVSAMQVKKQTKLWPGPAQGSKFCNSRDPPSENANFAHATELTKSIDDSCKKLDLPLINKIKVSVGDDTPL